MISNDYLNDLLSISLRFEEFNNAIDSASRHIAGMDSEVVVLCGQLKELNANIQTFSLQRYQSSSPDTVNYMANDNVEGNESVRKSTLFDQAKPYIDGAKSLEKIASSGLKIYEAFGKLPPVLEKVKTGLNVFDGAADVFEGVGTLAEATEAIEGIGAVGAIMTGAESIATALVPTGPIGWIAGGAVLLAGGATAYILSQNDNADKNEQSFADVGEKNGNAALINAQRTAKSAEDYIKLAQQMGDQKRISVETEKWKNTFLKEDTIQFDYQKAQSRDPSYINGLIAALNQNDNATVKPIKSLVFDDKTDMDDFEERFDKFKHFPVEVAKGIEVTRYLPKRADGPGMNITYTISRKEYNRNQSHTDIQQLSDNSKNELLKTAVQSYMINGFGYVKKEYENSLARFKLQPFLLEATEKLWKEFLSVKDIIDKEGNQVDPAKVSRHSKIKAGTIAEQYYGGRTIQININKPMIEHFTISTKDTKEGLGRLKQEVEEVLLEILDSVK